MCNVQCVMCNEHFALCNLDSSKQCLDHNFNIYFAILIRINDAVFLSRCFSCFLGSLLCIQTSLFCSHHFVFHFPTLMGIEPWVASIAGTLATIELSLNQSSFIASLSLPSRYLIVLFSTRIS